ncbi:MAG: 50S ribosomal protein L35 [Actinomycetota bacterium]
MPKMKSHRGAAKRIQVTGSGKLKRRRAFGNHFFGKKTSTRKRRIDRPADVSAADQKRIRRLIAK